LSVIQVTKIAQLRGHKASVFAFAKADDPHHFLSGAGDGWIVQWNLKEPGNGKLIAKVPENIFSLFNISDQQLIIAGNMNGGVHWIDLNNPEKTKNIAHHQKGVFDIQLIDNQVYTLGGGGMLTRWSIAERRALESFHITNQSLRAMSFSEDRNEIAIAASDNNIYILDAKSLSINHLIRNAHENSVFTVQYSPDDDYLLSGGRDAHLKVWAIERDFELVSEQAAHWFTINHIVYHPEGHIFATASRDKTIKIWDAENFQLLKVIDTIKNGGHINSVNKLYWSNYNNYLLSCSDDKSIIIWDVIY
jgi:WD repeat-containing protein 61